MDALVDSLGRFGAVLVSLLTGVGLFALGRLTRDEDCRRDVMEAEQRASAAEEALFCCIEAEHTTTLAKALWRLQDRREDRRHRRDLR